MLYRSVWSWTPGTEVYVSPDIPGGLTQTEPSGSGDQSQVIGIAVDANTIYVRPELRVTAIP